LLDRFINTHKVIKYNDLTRELAIINWGKYNLYKAGKPVIDCIKKELEEVKDKTLLWEVMNHIPNEDVVNEFSRVVYDTYHDTSTSSGEKEKEKEKEKQKEEEKENKIMAFDFYQSNFGMISGFIHENINYWIDQTSDELVVEAMKRTLLQNKRNFKYAEGILKNWISRNAKTLADVEAMDLEHEKDKVKPKQQKKNIHVSHEPTWMKNEPKSELTQGLKDLSWIDDL
jgi:DnaD/phage-associated family protein